jgi:hypothetical protein
MLVSYLAEARIKAFVSCSVDKLTTLGNVASSLAENEEIFGTFST